MKKFNHRIIYAVLFLAASLACTYFFFPYSPGRIAEAGKDIGLSAKFYFEVLFYGESGTQVSVTEYSKLPIKLPFGLPPTFEEFKALWGEFWSKTFSADMLQRYFLDLSNVLYYASKVLVILLPVIIVLIIVFKKSFEVKNNDYGKESLPLRIYKRVAKRFFSPVFGYIGSVFRYVFGQKWFKISLLLVWLLNFNGYSIFLEFIAYYLYFVMSFDFGSIYKQIIKLLADLSAVLSFVPVVVWVVLVFVALSVIARKRAKAHLRHLEMRNRGFLNERGVVTIVQGVPGAGKTAFCTDIALSCEAQFRDKAYEKLMECDLKFPFFPWVTLENMLKTAIFKRKVYDVYSAKKWVIKRKTRFEKKPCKENIFGYDYEQYPYYSNDKLKLESIWEVIENYVKFYLIYTVRSSLIVSNYSIRSDNVMLDEGNLPMWDTDFFGRDARFAEDYSRHSHIIDFDTLRLGKVLLRDNPYRYSFGFGVYVISEIDKERKNNLELTEVKRSEDECNQKNDMFSSLWKMSRHGCVVDNEVFVKMFADLQRPGNLGADVRELGEVICIEKQSEVVPVLPVYSPFWLFDTLYALVFDKFMNFYSTYRFNRGDDTLFCYLFKKIAAGLHKYRNGIYNLFGCQTLSVSVERGTMDGEKDMRKWYKMPFKVYSARYSTDCLSGIFEERAKSNKKGLDDLPEYSSGRASWEELSEQHSFFREDIRRFSGTEKPTVKVTVKKQSKTTKEKTPDNYDFDIVGVKKKK